MMADERGQCEDETFNQTRQTPEQEKRRDQSSSEPKDPEQADVPPNLVVEREGNNYPDPPANGKKPSSSDSTKKIVVAAAVGVAATALGVVAAPLIAGAALGAAGFTSAGVAAGSIAAGVQSTVYGGSVAAGSLFALFQSAGATGVIGSAATAAIGGSTGLAGFAATLGSFKLFGQKRSGTIKLVICGCGDGAHVFADIASSRENVDVRLLNLHQDEAESWVAAMRDAEFVVFATQAAYRQVYLEVLAPHIKPGTIIVGLPGCPDFENQVCHMLGVVASKCTIMNFESSPWTCETAKSGVKCEVIGTVDTLSGTLKKGDVTPKKDPVPTLQYLLGPFPQLKVQMSK